MKDKKYKFFMSATLPKTYSLIILEFLSLLRIILSTSLSCFSIEDEIFSTFGEILIIGTINLFTIIFALAFTINY